jgi:hypothetical protein
MAQHNPGPILGHGDGAALAQLCQDRRRILPERRIAKIQLGQWHDGVNC